MRNRRNLKLFCTFILFLTLISCETSNKSNIRTLTYNQSLNTDYSKEKILNKTINEKKILNVGILLPLSGKHYQIGKSLLNSAQLALNKTKEKNIVFKVVDTGNEDNLIKNFYEVLEQDIDIIIGPLFTKNIEKLRDIIVEKNVTTITLSNNSLLQEENILVFGLTFEDEINTLLKFSINSNLSSYAIVLPDNEYGRRIKDIFELYKSNNNSVSMKYELYNTKEQNFYNIAKNISDYELRKVNLKNEIEKFKKLGTEESKSKVSKLEQLDTFGELDFEAIIIITQNFTELSNLSSILPYYDVDPKKIKYMGTSQWNKQQALKEPGLNGGIFTAMDREKWDLFAGDYFGVFQQKPHILATLTYDLVGMISKLHSDDNIFHPDKLYYPSGFVGVGGWFKMNKDGDVLREPNIYKIKNEKFYLINTY